MRRRADDPYRELWPFQVFSDHTVSKCFEMGKIATVGATGHPFDDETRGHRHIAVHDVAGGLPGEHQVHEFLMTGGVDKVLIRC